MEFSGYLEVRTVSLVHITYVENFGGRGEGETSAFEGIDYGPPRGPDGGQGGGSGGGSRGEEVLVEGRAVIHINANARLTHASVTTTSPTRNAKMKTRMLRPLKLMDVIWDMLVMQR